MDIVSSMDNIVISNEEENSLMRAMHIPSGFFLNMVLKVAIELGLFEIIAKSSELSSYEIAAHLPTKNPKAPLVLERLLRFLASQSFLKCNITKDDGGHIHTSYNLTPLSKSLISSKDGTSVAPFLLLTTDPVFVSSWFHLKDAILEGEIPFNKAHGMHAFEYHEKDSRFNVVFNKAMQNLTCIETKRILESYVGFEGVKEVIDVGGGLGVLLASIVSKYPNIKGINFDLPHVIKDAPTYAGVEHIGGDMFENVPKGEVIILKAILHDWDDDHCLKILKNCCRALPKDGKVVVIEQIQQENPESTNLLSKHALSTDILMATMLAGGKERTKQEFETLAKDAGFASIKIVCRAYYCWVMELLKY